MTTHELIERLNDAAAESACLVWYRGHPLPLIGVKDSEGDYLLRGSPYGDSFATKGEVDFVLPLQHISTLTDEVARLRSGLQKLTKFYPPQGETFPYQADGYASGWRQACHDFQEAARATLTKAEGTGHDQ